MAGAGERHREEDNRDKCECHDCMPVPYPCCCQRFRWPVSACIEATAVHGCTGVGHTLGARGPGAETGAKADALFPFVLPWDDATESVIDLSEWLPKPAGEFGQVHAEADGHLYTGKDRIRFFGVDLAFSANIPSHAEAEKIAARMAKFGINIVRFHIMDMRRFPEGILARDGASTGDLTPKGWTVSTISRRNSTAAASTSTCAC